MNKLKSAIKNLEAYLGRDLQGLELLEKCTRLANEVRKENAALKEEVDELKKTIAAERERNKSSNCEEIKKENESLKTEAVHLKQKIVYLRSKLQVNKDKPEQRAGKISCPKARASCLKILKKDMPFLPAPMHGGKKQESTFKYAYKVEDIAKNYSMAEMAKLGRFVAMASTIVDVLITSDVNEKLVAKSNKSKENTEWVQDFVYWFGRRGIKESKIDEALGTAFLYDT